MNRFTKIFALSVPSLLAAGLTSNSASACGGCFVPPAESTVVSGHRMALSLSPKRTVLWDQIQYQGDPEEFSWVLPIKAGARIEVADPAFFEALEGVTATQISPPPLQCGGGGSVFGCGDSESAAISPRSTGDDGVTVVKQETVGPYDSVTLSSEDPAALTAWLESHNYAIPEDIKPTITAYVDEGFDFIALRLTPGNGVNLMTPVRVLTDGASPVLPLRMVAAGTGAQTAVVLYVIGEGRYRPENFPELLVPLGDLTWDGETNESNYALLRSEALSKTFGFGWITTYAHPNAFFGSGTYDENGGANANIGFTYFQQSGDLTNDWQTIQACSQAAQAATYSGGVVVDTCDPVTGECTEPLAGEVDARDFACGEHTDVATALVGMHPEDVWVTRLEASLSRLALGQDLQLGAHPSQQIVYNLHTTPKTVRYACPAAPFGLDSKDAPRGDGTPFVLVGLGAVATLLAARRRLSARPQMAS